MLTTDNVLTTRWPRVDDVLAMAGRNNYKGDTSDWGLGKPSAYKEDWVSSATPKLYPSTTRAASL